MTRTPAPLAFELALVVVVGVCTRPPQGYATEWGEPAVELGVTVQSTYKQRDGSGRSVRTVYRVRAFGRHLCDAASSVAAGVRVCVVGQFDPVEYWDRGQRRVAMQIGAMAIVRIDGGCGPD
jgi:single-stranded DNA-binding protein